ncbi:LacI family DNA-binding transcriptional regulator [Lacticaseibacillus baoqingensis]|uniref:LacI family DNA-binding transcriptional regulator n=1 Tax=Lacticaseibacillus baoqingensis TaxID=2486013 RepID=A0ABW4E6Z7_9LACO|nr:LacI family DNA-binding transcriptional regulator [Lacticaseibacillus baoqingensis]
MAKYTINDVAKAAGVSKATVSRYLNGRFERMSLATRRKIKAVIADLGYVPNYNASALKSKRSHQIGVVVGDVSNVYSTFLIKGISGVTRTRQDQILIADGGEDPQQETVAIKNLLSQNVDGIILQPARPDASGYQFLKDAGVPVVLVDRLLRPLLFPCVTSNDTASGKLLAQAALEKGYQNVIVLSHPVDQATVRYERYRAFAAVCRGANIPINLLEVEDADDVSGLRAALDAAQSMKSVIFATNGILLMAALRWLQQQQIAVPKQVGLCGYDDWNWGELANPPLAVVNQNPEKIGREVALRLEQLIAGKEVFVGRTEVPAEVHIRESL